VQVLPYQRNMDRLFVMVAAIINVEVALNYTTCESLQDVSLHHPTWYRATGNEGCSWPKTTLEHIYE
jgi:hypothetical protein